MVTQIEESRILAVDEQNKLVKVDVTNTYVLLFNSLRDFAAKGMLTIDVSTFSKTIQGEAFLALNAKMNADLVLVNRAERNGLNIRHLSGYDGYFLYVSGKELCRFGSLKGQAGNANVMLKTKEAISKTLKLKSVKFTVSQLEIDEITRKLFN